VRERWEWEMVVRMRENDEKRDGGKSERGETRKKRKGESGARGEREGRRWGNREFERKGGE